MGNEFLFPELNENKPSTQKPLPGFDEVAHDSGVSEIYTSNFSSIRRLRKELSSHRLVSIARFSPRWWKGDIDLMLAPSESALRAIRSGDIESYCEMYDGLLNSLDPVEVFEKFTNSVMLCFCARGNFCHRRLVAEWIQHTLDIVVPEFGCDFELPKLTEFVPD